jgi:hypothetical protein
VIYIGVAQESASLDKAFFCDGAGWGFGCNRELFHGYSKLKDNYGEEFTSGDKISVFIDSSRGELSFAKNGKEYGVAFRSEQFKTETVFPALYLHKSIVRIHTE